MLRAFKIIAQIRAHSTRQNGTDCNLRESTSIYVHVYGNHASGIFVLQTIENNSVRSLSLPASNSCVSII